MGDPAAPPAWLSAPPAATAQPPPPALPSHQASSQPVSQPGWSNAQPPPPGPEPMRAAPPPTGEDMEQGRRFMLYMRLINVLLTALICFAAVIELIAGADLALGIICLYAFGFAVLICCFETHLTRVALLIEDNFGFMYDAVGRFLFMIFVGILCGSLGLVGYIAGALLIVNAVFGFIVMYKYPTVFREERESLEATLGRKARENPQLATQAISAGASWAAQNPEQAQAMARQQQQQQQRY